MAAQHKNDAGKTASPNRAQPRHPKASPGQMTLRGREKGRKPATTNHLHLQPQLWQQSQHRQGTPALSQSSSPPCPQLALLFLFIACVSFFFLAYRPIIISQSQHFCFFYHQEHITSTSGSPFRSLIVIVYSGHFDIRLKTSTPALYPSGHTSTLNCQCCFRSQKICFFFLSLSFLALIILFCSFLILLRSFTFMKFRLKIGAMHCQFVMLFICVFLEKGKKHFFRGKSKKCSIFYNKLLEVFQVMWGRLNETHCLAPM